MAVTVSPLAEALRHLEEARRIVTDSTEPGLRRGQVLGLLDASWRSTRALSRDVSTAAPSVDVTGLFSEDAAQ